MLIININGPINAGKTTVSKILVKNLQKATFIEVDDLLNKTEEASLHLSLKSGWQERIHRLNRLLKQYKKTQAFQTVIFAYPITEKTHNEWSSLCDDDTQFINITLSPSLKNCLTNRGTRQLTKWEKKRIVEMYKEGYQNRPYSDLIINNDNQSPDETATIIQDFITHIQNPKQQWLHLVERRWEALLTGKKTSTFRINEGFVHRGFLIYKDYPKEQKQAVVYVNKVYYVPFKQAIEIDGFDEHTPNVETALKQMRIHYPDITLETPILLAQHLGVPETEEKYPVQVAEILKNTL